MSKYKYLLASLLGMTESLKNSAGEKIELINQVPQKEWALLSVNDLSNPLIAKNNTLPIKLYFEHVLFVQAEKNKKVVDSCPVNKFFVEFKGFIIQQLDNMEQILKELSETIKKEKPLIFLQEFSIGALGDSGIFKNTIEKVISFLAKDENNKNEEIKYYEELFNLQKNKFSNLFQSFQQKIMNEILITDHNLPKIIQKTTQVSEKKKFLIRDSSSFDIHPTKNLLISIANNAQEIILEDFSNDKEVKRTKLEYNCDLYNFKNCLWSPSGNKILVTLNDSTLLVFNEECKLMHAISNNCLEASCLTTNWISDKVIICCYNLGYLRFYNSNNAMEIKTLQLSESENCSLQKLDNNHILIGDDHGCLKKLNWKENKMIWINELHDKNSKINLIYIPSDQEKAFTSSNNNFIKGISLLDQTLIWERKLNSQVITIDSLKRGDTILVFLSCSQLFIIQQKNGNFLFEFDCFPEFCQSVRLQTRTRLLLVGDHEGGIAKYQFS